MSAAVAFHTAFNMRWGLLFLPFTTLVAKLVNRLVPDERREIDNLAELRYLDPTALSTPNVALANASLETVRMSELLDRMLKNALAPLRNGSIETLKELKSIDDKINRYQAAVQSYLADLTQPLPWKKRGARWRSCFMSAISSMPATSFISTSSSASSRRPRKASPSRWNSMPRWTISASSSITLRLATGVLTTSDVEAAKRLVAQKDAFRAMENR